MAKFHTRTSWTIFLLFGIKKYSKTLSAAQNEKLLLTMVTSVVGKRSGEDGTVARTVGAFRTQFFDFLCHWKRKLNSLLKISIFLINLERCNAIIPCDHTLTACSRVWRLPSHGCVNFRWGSPCFRVQPSVPRRRDMTEAFVV